MPATTCAKRFAGHKVSLDQRPHHLNHRLISTPTTERSRLFRSGPGCVIKIVQRNDWTRCHGVDQYLVVSQLKGKSFCER